MVVAMGVRHGAAGIYEVVHFCNLQEDFDQVVYDCNRGLDEN